MLIPVYVVANAFINSLSNIRQKFIGQSQESFHALIAQLVIDKTALLLPANQPTIIKTAKVVGSVGLGETGGFNDLTDS
jgi:hypothetical protein